MSVSRLAGDGEVVMRIERLELVEGYLGRVGVWFDRLHVEGPF